MPLSLCGFRSSDPTTIWFTAARPDPLRHQFSGICHFIGVQSFIASCQSIFGHNFFIYTAICTVHEVPSTAFYPFKSPLHRSDPVTLHCSPFLLRRAASLLNFTSNSYTLLVSRFPILRFTCLNHFQTFLSTLFHLLSHTNCAPLLMHPPCIHPVKSVNN